MAQASRYGLTGHETVPRIHRGPRTLLPMDLVDPEVRSGFEMAKKGAQASGTPFLSFFTPAEMMALAREGGFKQVQHVTGGELAQLYFADRTDGLRPPNNAENLLIATA